ncbi:hypothetical protein [Xanthomonas theicola]|uniref:hypothetical protein n=1 Tax=Xanthomonas theicola TaxID=56464 RepID=UPI000FF895EC|nr:hypothetical protein [Xanthomonas theicola]QNH26798.1 hypothetical protein G4Q83_21655 [Xanthomonas theicola]
MDSAYTSRAEAMMSQPQDFESSSLLRRIKERLDSLPPHAICAVEPVDEAKAVDACRGEGVPVTRAIPRKCAGDGENQGLSAVSVADLDCLIL